MDGPFWETSTGARTGNWAAAYMNLEGSDSQVLFHEYDSLTNPMPDPMMIVYPIGIPEDVLASTLLNKPAPIMDRHHPAHNVGRYFWLTPTMIPATIAAGAQEAKPRVCTPDVNALDPLHA